jgi:hypothetical protein
MKKILLASIIIFSGIFLSCSREEPFVAPPPPVPVVEVKINEIYSRGTAGNEDWIEIYNPASSSKDISGYKIYDSGGESGSKPKKEIPVGTVIPAGGFFVIIVDDTTESGFGLGSSGEKVWLENSASALIDSVTFPALGNDTSYARNPNGSSVWVKLSPPTKGTTNVTGGGGETQPLVMNEFFSRGVDPDFDWIEIYNPNSVQVELTGYKIYDGGGNLGTKPKMEFPVGSVIPANGFYVIVVDIQDAAGFGLGSGGDECWLENPSGTVIDNQLIPAMPVATTSYCRVPDGSLTWLISNNITKGAPNQP